MIERMVVLLPTPLRPSRQTHSPARDLERHAEQRLRQAVVGVNLLRPAGVIGADPQVDAPHLGVAADLLAACRRRSAGPGAAPRCAARSRTPPSMSCSVNSSVRPRSAAMRRSSAIESRVSAADMPAVGSSSSRISGRPASAMPSSSCFWLPCDSAPPASAALSSRSTSRSSASASSRYRPAASRPEVAAAAAVRDDRRLHVLEHRELRKDVGALERAADAERAQAVRREAGDVAPVQAHAARVGTQVPGEQVEAASTCPRRSGR